MAAAGLPLRSVLGRGRPAARRRSKAEQGASACSRRPSVRAPQPDYAYLRKLFRDLFVREGEPPRRRPRRGCCWNRRCTASPVRLPPPAPPPRTYERTTHLRCPATATSSLPRAPGFTWDYVFDWTILKYAQQQSSRPSSSRPADGGYAPQPARAADDAEAALRRLGLQ